MNYIPDYSRKISSALVAWFPAIIMLSILAGVVLLFVSSASYHNKETKCEVISKNFESGVFYNPDLGGCTKVARDGTIRVFTYDKENDTLTVNTRKLKIKLESE